MHNIEQARYLLRTPDPDCGVALLVKILAVPVLHALTETRARHLLRKHWQQHPSDVENAWSAAQETPAPAWLALTNDNISTVTAWITTPTWAESRWCFIGHADQLLDETTSAVLDELALSLMRS
jgi:hypothetical protein